MKFILEKYNINYKNSTPAEDESRTSPSYPQELAVDIQSIRQELTTKEIKKIKAGEKFEFEIEQHIEVSANNSKKLKSREVVGDGEGEVIEIQNFNASLADDEYQEITIILKNGYAERLR